MFGFFLRKRVKDFEDKTKEGFSQVKKDISVIENWIKHLDKQDKQLFDMFYSLRRDLSSISDTVESVQEGVHLSVETPKSKQVFKKLPVFEKQTADEDVYNAVQTAVQTDNIYDILKNLSTNERLLVMTLMNNDMKLSYEDLGLLVGKDKSTIRGQINAIKQKNEGLIEEFAEKSGKKRLYIPAPMKDKFAKYAKVRGKKSTKNLQSES